MLADVTDQHGGFPARRRQAMQNLQIPGHETFLEQKVARRVARDGQFGKKHEFRFFFLGALETLPDLGFIAFEVADGRIDLGQGNSHRRRINVAGKLPYSVLTSVPAVMWCRENHPWFTSRTYCTLAESAVTGVSS